MTFLLNTTNNIHRILAQSGLINPTRPDIPSLIVSIVEL